MLPRERMHAAIDFRPVDKAALQYHASPRGFYEHGEKLKKLFDTMPDDFGTVFTGEIPRPPDNAYDENKDYHESGMEQEIINKIQDFLLELGKGFSFVSRQKRITTDGGEHYYIDLVFYNYILKCFIVIDLKTGKLTYQDIGQIDFYVRLFDDKIKQSDDNPTIGIVLCADKDESIVKYSVLSDKDNLFATKYMLYLPTEEELKRELEGWDTTNA